MSGHGQILTHSTDRHGGVSGNPYHSLNLSYGVGDSADAVRENRKILKAKLSIPTLVSAQQVHGDDVFIVDSECAEDLEVENFDALLTDIPGVALLIQQADCQAVTLYDPVHSAIAAIHCGWQGSVLNVLAKTIRIMNSQYGSRPAELQAAVSPSLGPCCGEFTNHAQELPPSFLAFQVKENYFDFWRISEKQLTDTGVKRKNIIISGRCTSCSPDYFSYRRACRGGDGRTGRCGTVIALL